jgi:autotransporter-associated beta strand protein
MTYRNSIGFLFLLALSAVLALAATPASAVVYSWNGQALTSSWSSAGNWANLASPGQFDTAQFPYSNSGYTNQPSTDTPSDIVGAVWDNGSGSVTIGGAGALTITGTLVGSNASTGVELDLGAGSLTINCPITMGANQQWINNSANPITVTSTINGNGKNMTLNTVGSGSLLLAGSVGSMATSGTNYFGNVTLTGTAAAGNVLFLGYSGSTTAGASTTTTIGSGGLLNIVATAGTTTIANNVTVNGGTIQSTASSGTVGLGWVASQGGALNISNGLVNFGNLTVNFGRAAKGFINLNGGTFIMNAAPTVSTNGGTLNFNGGTLQLGGNIASFAPTSLGLNVSNGGANINLNGFNTTISGSLTNPGGTSTGGLTLNTTTGGSLTLSGTNTFAGVTLLNGGTLVLTNSAALLNSTFDTSGAGTLSLGSLTAATFGGLRGTGGTFTLMNNAAAPAPLALSVGNNGTNTTFNGTLTGGGSLTKVGAGILTLTGSTSNYSGATNINAGVLNYASTLAMPGTSTINVASGAVLGAAVGGANPFIFGGSGPGTTGGLLAGAGPLGNAINWSANSMLGIDTSGSSLAVNGYSSGNVGVAKLGSGAMVMSGTNTYSGPTAVYSGTLDINSPYAIGTGTLNLAGGVIDNTSGGPVTLGNVPQVWSNNFSFGGSNFLNLGTGTVSVTNAVTATVSGSTLQVDGNISGNGNSSNMTFNTAGAGTLLLTGNLTNMGSSGNNSFGNVTIAGTIAAPRLLFVGLAASPLSSGTTTIVPGGLLNLLTGNSNLAFSSYVVVNGGTIQNVSAPTSDIVGFGWSAGQAGTFTINSGLANFSGVNVNFGHAVKGIVNLNGGTFVINSEPTGSGPYGNFNFNGGTMQLSGSIPVFAPTQMTLNVGNGGANFNLGGFNTTIFQSFVGTGNGGLTLLSPSGSGTLTLSPSTAEGYTGPTTVLGGTLLLTNTALTAAGASVLPANSSLAVSNGKVSLAGNSSFAYGINNTAAGTVTLNSGGVLSADQTQNNTTNLYTLTMNGGTLAATQPPAVNNQHFTINNQVFATGGAPSLISANIGDAGSGLTVDVAPGSQLTLSGQLSDIGPVSLNKANNGALIISSSQTSYTGSTTVSGGTLAIDATGTNTGALGPTAVNVLSGASFVARGNTSIASGGGLVVFGGASLDLRDAQVNTFTVNGNLSLGTGAQGSNVNLELGTGTADLVNVTGAASATGVSTVNISLANGGSVVPGSYELITAASGLAAGNFTVGSKPAGFNSYTLSMPTAGALVLSITGNPTPGTAYWTGAASKALADAANQWGIGSTINTSNWSTTPDGLTDPEQVPGAITNVIFTAANAVGNGAGSLTTNLDTNYSINGLNIAVSSGTITSLAINTANNSLTIGAGGLTLANNSNAGASISGTGGAIVNGSQSWANNSSLPLAVSAPIAAYSGPTTLTINGAGSGGAALGGVVSDGVSGGTLSLVLNQAGLVTLGGTAANTYSGGTTISSGLVRLMGAGALGSAAGSLTANGGSLDLNGNSVTVSGGLSGAAGTIYNNAGSGVAMITVAKGGSFSGNIADNVGVPGGSIALVFSGSGNGALALSGTNTYSGGTTISGGVLDINSNSAVGSGTLTIAGGSIDNTSGHPVTLGNIAEVWSGNFTFKGSNYLNLGTGAVSVTAVTSTTTRTITLSAGTLEVDGNITAASPISTNGNGTLILGGSNSITAYSANVFGAFSNLTSTGTTSLVGGPFVTGANTTLTIASGLFTVSSSAANAPTTALGNNGNAASPPATMLVSGGTFSQLTGNLAIAQHSPGVLTINSGLVSLANALEFTVPAGNATGTVNLNGGQLDLPVLTVVGSSTSDVFNFNGGLLQLTASSANLITSNSGSYVTMNVGDGGANIDLNGHATTISNALLATGSGGLTVYSSAPGGKLTLTAANFYNGNTTINGGIVNPANGTALSSGTVTVNTGGQIYCTSTQFIANPLVLSGTGANGAALEQGGNSATNYVGPVSLAGNTTIHTDGSAGLTFQGNVALNGYTLTVNGDGGSTTTFSGNIAADSGALVCNAQGLTLSGSNGYTGGTTVIGGAVVLGGPSALGPGALAANGGVVSLNGFGATVTSFRGAAGTVTNNGALPAELTVSQTGTTTFSGLLRDGTSQLSLDVNGSGTLILGGVGLYTGGTTVETGTLVVTSSGAIEDGTNLDIGTGLMAFAAPVVPSPASAAASAPAVAAVPEPGTLALIGAAGTLLLLYRRRR